MPTKRKAPTTEYFALWREDYQDGGVYFKLSDCAISVKIRLEAHCDGEGWIRRKDGVGCSKNELQSITNTPYKRLQKALIELQNNNAILINAEGAIKIISHFHDNGRRKQNRDNRGLLEANGQPLKDKIVR